MTNPSLYFIWGWVIRDLVLPHFPFKIEYYLIKFIQKLTLFNILSEVENNTLIHLHISSFLIRLNLPVIGCWPFVDQLQIAAVHIGKNDCHAAAQNTPEFMGFLPKLSCLQFYRNANTTDVLKHSNSMAGCYVSIPLTWIWDCHHWQVE